jgi:hypothetical protein
MILRVSLLIILLSFGCVDINAQAKSERAVEAQLRKMYSDDDGEVRYFLKWFDLNGDGIPEKTYPDNPTVALAEPLKGRPHGIVLIKNFKGYIGSKRLNLSARTDTDKTPLDSNQSATIIAVFYKPGS